VQRRSASSSILSACSAFACKMTQSVSEDCFRSDGRVQTVFEDEDDDENDYESCGIPLLAPIRSERAEDPKPTAGLIDTDVATIDVIVRDMLVSALNHKAPMFIDEVASAHVPL
jgi:hypothetical protein